MEHQGPMGPALDVREERKKRITENLARIRHTVVVLSGKGGVGKTTVAVNLAAAVGAAGREVGLLDVDLHGPNAALMAGVDDGTTGIVGDRIRPARASGIQVLSLAGLLPDKNAAVIWRGPMKNTVIEQFLGDSDFGDLDLLVVDSPPGTGDEPLSVAQLIPQADGAVIVTTPQDVALMDGRRSVNFARQLGMPVIGLVENMSGLICPHCSQEVELFGPTRTEAVARELGVPFLGRIPFSTHGPSAGDQGEPLVLSHPEDPAATALRELAEEVSQAIRLGESRDAKGSEEKGSEEKGKEMISQERKIAIACDDDRGLEAEVSAHFGRCPYYTVARVVDGRLIGHEVKPNPHYGNHRPGVVPQLIHSWGAHVILAGGMGPRAIDMFRSFRIEVATGALGVAGKVLEAYLAGQLTGVVPCEHDHPESCGGRS